MGVTSLRVTAETKALRNNGLVPPASLRMQKTLSLGRKARLLGG